MKVAVIGSGYVGLVLGACLAESGNDVVCADIDTDKVARLNNGEMPIHEPGLGPLVRNNLATGRLTSKIKLVFATLFEESTEVTFPKE